MFPAAPHPTGPGLLRAWCWVQSAVPRYGRDNPRSNRLFREDACEKHPPECRQVRIGYFLRLDSFLCLRTVMTIAQRFNTGINAIHTSQLGVCAANKERRFTNRRWFWFGGL